MPFKLDCTVLKVTSNEFKGKVYYAAQIIFTSGDVMKVSMENGGDVHKDESGTATFKLTQGYNMTPKIVIVGFE